VQATDTSAIQRLIDRARRRIRGQWALEGATTATILAAAAAMVVIFLMRIEAVGRPTGLALLVGTIGIVIVGAVVKSARRLDDELVARRIDRASNLSDRLSTAIAFTRTGVPQNGGDGADETHELMLAAIRDGVRAVPRADIAHATPFAVPSDLRAALGFIAISALAAGLAVPTVDRTPHLYRVDPDHAASGDDVVLKGVNLMTGISRPIASLPVRSSIGATNVPAEAVEPPPGLGIHGFVPPDAAVYLGAGKARPARVLDWSADQIVIRVPDAPLGPTTLTAWIGDEAVGPLAFTVIDRRDPDYHKAGSVELDPDDRAYLDALLAELRAVAKHDKVPELEDFAKQIEQLLKDAELGKISKEQLLDALAKAEDKMNKDAEPNQAELNKQLADMGKELSKDQTTKELGDALQKNDLDKAKQELEKLAEKLDQKQLSDQQKEELAKQLDKVAKQMDQKDQKQEQKQQEQQQKLEEDIRRLEKKKEQAKTDQERLDTERQLNKKKDELKKLEKDQQDKEQSAERQALKRLTRDMEKAAENLQKPQKDPNDKQNQQEQEQEQRDQQASQKLKDAARETGRVDQDQRKQATQKKMSSQMDDLREAMRRAKQKGNKGQQDPFGKQGKNRDFAQRSRGQKGQGEAWKPGQGQRPGQGQGQGQGGQGQGGQGQQAGGKEWGVGHDPNLTGDPTDKSGNTKDDDLQGKQGKDGGGTRETILAAAQKGFASEHYRDIYGKYHQIVEEVMRTEKLPSSYKYFVKRYFAKIHPSTEAPADAAPASKTDGKTGGKTEDHAP